MVGSEEVRRAAGLRIVQQRARAVVCAVAAHVRHARHRPALVQIFGLTHRVDVAGARCLLGHGLLHLLWAVGKVRQLGHGNLHLGCVRVGADLDFHNGLRAAEIGAPIGARRVFVRAAVAQLLGMGLQFSGPQLNAFCARLVVKAHDCAYRQLLHQHAKTHALSGWRLKRDGRHARAVGCALPVQQRRSRCHGGGLRHVALHADLHRCARQGIHGRLERALLEVGCGRRQRHALNGRTGGHAPHHGGIRLGSHGRALGGGIERLDALREIGLRRRDRRAGIGGRHCSTAVARAVVIAATTTAAAARHDQRQTTGQPPYLGMFSHQSLLLDQPIIQ
ncbi:hypothetical protein SDC9_103922 [bioreactor metagenome]|uniref:Uncharacterized protein n=1 Tax=bioreactor metagenome TaxID=1076179 RepID=A0A645B5U5_9ZZZZ